MSRNYDQDRSLVLNPDTWKDLINQASNMDMSYSELAESAINKYLRSIKSVNDAIVIKSKLKYRRPDTTPMVDQSIHLVCHAEAVEEEIKYLHENNLNDFDPGILSDALEVCEKCVAKLKPVIKEYLK